MNNREKRFWITKLEGTIYLKDMSVEHIWNAIAFVNTSSLNIELKNSMITIFEEEFERREYCRIYDLWKDIDTKALTNLKEKFIKLIVNKEVSNKDLLFKYTISVSVITNILEQRMNEIDTRYY